MAYEIVDNQTLIDKFGKTTTDTGSTVVQIAVMTNRINHLTDHSKVNPKDHAGRRGLLRLVGKRRRLLNYLADRDIERYRTLLGELGLRR